MLTLIIILVSTIVLVGVDQLTKYIVAANFSVGESRTAIDGLLNWTYVQNKGAAFGMMQNQRWFFIIGTAAIIAFIIYVLVRKKVHHWSGLTAATLVLAGGIGNLIDRCLYGYVIDFFDISPLFSFPVWNVADMCITVGGILFAVYVLFIHDKFAPKEEKAEETNG